MRKRGGLLLTVGGMCFNCINKLKARTVMHTVPKFGFAWPAAKVSNKHLLEIFTFALFLASAGLLGVTSWSF